MGTEDSQARERADLLETLASRRNFLRQTCRDLSDEQAAQRTTVSELCLGGLIKHCALVERNWIRFIQDGPSAMTSIAGEGPAAWQDMFRMTGGETLAGLLAQYGDIASETEKVVSGLDNLDADHPLPERPWFPKGTRWSARRVLLHIIAETSQHAGHADIIRESLDGAKTMG